MYCPKCNQQQASDEMRFCSRCGFPLTVVAYLLAHDGALVLPGSYQKKKSRSSRSKIISESAYLTLVSWAVAFAATFLVNYGGPLEIAAKIAAVNFFLLGMVGLIRFIYGFFFVSDSGSPEDESLERLIREQATRPALPPQQSLPISDYSPRVNTREMAPRPSVTENTTRLLDDTPGHQVE
jgi:hypothetical protein